MLRIFTIGLLAVMFASSSSGCNMAWKDHPQLTKSLKQDPPPTPSVAEAPLSDAAKACLASAQELEDKGRDAEAILLYERARTYNPQSTEIGVKLAMLYQRQGRYGEALEEYKKALAVKPKDPDLLNDMGFFFLERGHWAEAEKALREAVAVNPKHTQAWGNLGLTLGYAGRYMESLEAFHRSVTPAEAYANLGMILSQQQKPEEAKEALQRAVKLNPDLEQARQALAWLQMSPADRAEIMQRQESEAQAAKRGRLSQANVGNAAPGVPQR